MKFKNYKYISTLLAATLLAPLPVHAASTDDTAADSIRDQILDIVDMMNDKIETEIDTARDSIAGECIAGDYDYYSSTESFNRQQNPYKQSDYISLISAYLTVKNYKSVSYADSLYTMSFIQKDSTPASMESYEPMQIPYYEEISSGSGQYSLSGTDIIALPSTIPTFEKNEDGFYYITGEMLAVPKSCSVNYLEYTLSGITGDDIFERYGIEKTATVSKYYDSVYSKMNNIINGESIRSSSFLKIASDVKIPEEATEVISSLMDSDTDERVKTVISVACSLVGKIPYEWGGKPSAPGWDSSWWSIGSNGEQKGLDCSGFVKWCFMTAGFDDNICNQLSSTSTILTMDNTVSENNLQPGDIGLLNTGVNEINHTGIYLGNGWWIHCSSSSGVTVEQTDMFTIYKRFPTGTCSEDVMLAVKNGSFTLDGYSKTDEASSDDITLLAKLIMNEASGEGMNGWIAVAEVVKNRMNSSSFPNSLSDVIYAEGQFSDNDRIASQQPSEEVLFVAREVLSGNLAYFNNPNILYFRNAGGSTSDWGNLEYYDTVNHHQFYLG